MKKHKAYLLFVLYLTLLLSGCNAKIATKSQLLDYANETYGKAKYLDYYEDDGKSYLILKDAEYGFEYSVWSYVKDFSVDGSKFGEYENKESDFLENYENFIREEYADEFTDLENKHQSKTQWNEFYSPKNNYEASIISLYISTEENAEVIAKEFYDIIDKIDTRKFFSKGSIGVLFDDEYIGEYSFLDDRYKTKDEVNIIWAMENAIHIMNIYMDIKIDSVNELTYLHMETMDIKDIPGYDINNTTFRTTDTEESLANTAVYYFEYNNNKWIIADCIVGPYGNLHVYKLGE